MTPFIGQGANQAMTDSIQLAESLSSCRDATGRLDASSVRVAFEPEGPRCGEVFTSCMLTAPGEHFQFATPKCHNRHER
ncbi:hypothetical protein AK812_SmicGene39266 [Symbiodinium microadriaticum]|uniref:Uncharacterized protein n=1 Tax=Symbiodinium microadriaticum TaxID=2951 RepID=A0A1Q9CBM4_SYMMI|nr:hypothetical protein AK812_SmicGene39266 [Symbiodinium microadriaticum]